MEGNKLTDEEIVKALGYCTKSRCDDETTGNCPLKNDESCGTILAINALDLIRRLQEENECLNAKDRLNQIDIDELHKEREKRVEEVYADFMQDYKIMREELKACQNELAEYERKLADGELDIASYARSWEEGDNRTVTCDLLNAMEQAVAVFNKQKSEIEVLKTELQKECQEHLAFAVLAKKADEQQKKEIERLTEENEHLDGCAKQFLTDYQNEQVKSDEFEKRYLEESKERCRFEQLYKKICHDHNIGLGVQRKHWEKKVQQAVKDTAKEILTELIEKAHSNGCIDLTVNEAKAWFREDYSVEVE